MTTTFGHPYLAIKRIVDGTSLWYAGLMGYFQSVSQSFSNRSLDQQFITHPKYRQIALTIYVGVLINGLFNWLVGRPMTSVFSLPNGVPILIFCAAVGSLIFLEATRSSQPKSIGYLVVIVTLSGIAIAVSPYLFSQLLLLIAVLFAELTFSSRTSWITIGVTFFLLFMRMAFGPRRDFISVSDIQALMMYILVMLLILLMGRLIKGEWDNGRRLSSLHDELNESHQQLKQTSDKLTELAVVNERNRMARDIHDSLGHHLAAVSVQLEMAIKLFEREPSASLQAMTVAKSATQEALEEVRQSVGALQQPNQPFELASAVDLLISRIASQSLSIAKIIDGDEHSFSQKIRLVFFRAIQEGLTNAHKHASASRVNIWLQFSRQQARLRIIDDGVGFDVAQESAGNGLSGMRERVSELDGIVEIDSRPDEGTVLDITIPKPNS